MYFDIYFSNFHGLEIDFPFLNVLIPSSVVYVALVIGTVLRIRKVYFLNSKKGRK